MSLFYNTHLYLFFCRPYNYQYNNNHIKSSLLYVIITRRCLFFVSFRYLYIANTKYESILFCTTNFYTFVIFQITPELGIYLLALYTTQLLGKWLLVSCRIDYTAYRFHAYIFYISKGLSI